MPSVEMDLLDLCGYDQHGLATLPVLHGYFENMQLETRGTPGGHLGPFSIQEYRPPESEGEIAAVSGIGLRQ